MSFLFASLCKVRKNALCAYFGNHFPVVMMSCAFIFRLVVKLQGANHCCVCVGKILALLLPTTTIVDKKFVKVKVMFFTQQNCL